MGWIQPPAYKEDHTIFGYVLGSPIYGTPHNSPQNLVAVIPRTCRTRLLGSRTSGLKDSELGSDTLDTSC